MIFPFWAAVVFRGCSLYEKSLKNFHNKHSKYLNIKYLECLFVSMKTATAAIYSLWQKKEK